MKKLLSDDFYSASLKILFRQCLRPLCAVTESLDQSIHIRLKAAFRLRFYGLFERGGHIGRAVDFSRFFIPPEAARTVGLFCVILCYNFYKPNTDFAIDGIGAVCYNYTWRARLGL